MSIKPIDLQVNVAQMHEVAKGTQVRTDAIAEQQHGLDKESLEKSRLADKTVEENKKAERTIIMHEEKHGRRRGGEKNEQEPGAGDKREGSEESGPVDERMGRFIDIKK